MKRRIFSIGLIISVLVVSSLLLKTIKASATTPTPSASPTSTALPGADFVGSPTAGFAPLTVQFTAINNSVLSTCTWTFGDGTSETLNGQFNVCPSTSHVYSTPGFYTVSLKVVKVATGATNTMTKTNYIQVTAPGVFTVTPTPTRIPCGAIIVVTSTFTPTITATPRIATATPTSCGPIYITATPNGPTNGPDLTISSITYAGSSPACANMPKNNVVVTNNGNAAAGTFMVSYSAGGVPAPAQTVTGLAAGQSITLSFPSASGAGMSATATADSTNVIAETNESNNTNSAILPVPTQAATCTPTRTPTRTPTPTITPTGSNLPDLTISSVTYLGSSPACANSPKVQVVVANIGAFPATGSFSVSLSGSAPQTVSGLAAGQSVTLIFSASGTTATADSTNVIVETNESNNSLTGSFGLPTQAHTCTPTSGTPVTPTRTFTPTPSATPVIGACSPVTSTITIPFIFDGGGVFCWQASSLGGFINSWNTTSVSVNGVNVTNIWVGSGSYPAKIGGFYYVSYNSAVAFGHFEAKP